MEIYTCCICGESFEGYGNNPEPIKQDGRCCDNCNMMEVVPARLMVYFNHKVGGETK